MTDRSFRIKKCIYWDRNIGNYESWQIEDSNGNSLFWPNVWLAKLRNQTVRQYAYKLRAFLEYLAEKGKTYLEANTRDLSQFLTCLRFHNSDGVYTINESVVSYSTITSYMAAISSFYRTLVAFRDDIEMQMVDANKSVNSNSFLYHIAWTKEYKKILVEKFMDRYQPKREYEKWYTDEEENAILSCLGTHRDKAVFLFTLCGMRIDEVLSTNLYDYNITERSVVAYRSKGKRTGNTQRAVALSNAAISELEAYLTYERATLEEEFLLQGKVLSTQLFIGLKHNQGYGKPLQYRNYLQILKRAAEKAGMDPQKIRTHSGRSTSAMRDVLFHAEHPDLLSLDDIRIKYGWKSIDSIQPYLDTSNPKISLDNRKLLDKVRNENVGEVTGKFNEI